MFIFFIPVFDCSHAYKPYKSHLALFIISNKSFTRSFSASNDYFPHRTTISYRNAEALYLKLFEIQCFPAFSISSCWYYYFTILHTLWEWLYLSKKKPAVYSRTTDFLYYSFYLLRCVSDKFSIFKHNLLPSRYPSSLLSAPITFAMDCATEGFSAITNFIFFHSNFVSFFHFLFAFW